ncbi:MAG: hypothetical protein ACK4Z8_14815 [Novosphingobium sp.]
MGSRIVRGGLLAGTLVLAACNSAPNSPSDEAMDAATEAAADMGSDSRGLDDGEDVAASEASGEALEAGAGFDPDEIVKANPPAAGGTVDCEATDSEETPEACARFETQLAKVKAGLDGFEPQQKMTRGKLAIVRYSISVADDAAQAGGGTLRTDSPEARKAVEEAGERAIAAAVPDAQAGSASSQAVEVGREMSACLNGATFDIAIDGAEGPVGTEQGRCKTLRRADSRTMLWEWQVTPRTEGQQKLDLTVSVVLKNQDGSIRKVGTKSFTREIRVAVKPVDWWKEAVATATEFVQTPMGLIAALVSLLGALGGLRVAWRRFRRGGDSSEATPPEGGNG